MSLSRVFVCVQFDEPFVTILARVAQDTPTQ